MFNDLIKLVFSVTPAFPLFTPDILNTTGAVFIGVQQDALYGPLNTWQLQVCAV